MAMHGPVGGLPFNVLILAELAPRHPQTGSVRSGLGRIRIDRDNFDAVMTQLAGSVILDVPNRLAVRPQTLMVELRVNNLGAFRPEAIAEQAPGPRQLLELRQLVLQWQNRQMSRQDLQQRLGETLQGTALYESIQQALASPEPTVSSAPSPSPSAPAPTGKPHGDDKQDALDALLDMVEIPDATPSPRRTVPESLLDCLMPLLAPADRTAGPVNREMADALLAGLDAALSTQVNDILHHPELRRLESTWRGLKFLVDRCDFRQNIRLEILNTSKAALLDTLRDKVCAVEDTRHSETPLSVIVADYMFDRSAPDIELLQAIAEQAEGLGVPLIAAIGPAFFGLESVEALHRLPSSTGDYFAGPEYIKWNAFRQSDASRWMSLAFNRYLLRLPYGSDEARVKTFQFNEDVPEAADGYLWGNPVWALASLLTASFAKSGWPTEITGLRGGGAIEDLPVWAHGHAGHTAMIPLETLLTEVQALDLSINGILVLTCYANTDMASVLAAPTAHRPERYSNERASAASALHATLPYQLAASRIAQYIGHVYRDIVPGNTPEGIKRDFTHALRECLATSGPLSPDAVRVEVAACDEQPGGYEVTLYARPARTVLGGHAVVEMRLHIFP